MKQTQGIKTKRLVLTPLGDGELRAAMEAETDPHMKNAYREMLELCLAKPEERLWCTNWAIALKNGPVIGGLSFKGPPENYEVEIGYGIDDPAYRRQGYAYEAVSAAIEWALANHDGVWFVTAETEPDNEASQGLLKKLGFVPAGQGVEGPRFEKGREAANWTSIYMCMGLSLGMLWGLLLDNISIGMCIGLALGVAVGTSMDGKSRRERERVLAAHAAAKRSASAGGVVEVAAALIWDGGRFMICRRPENKARGGLWEFVGGKLEPGESAQQALIRECREELAIEVLPTEKYMDVTHEYPDITVHLTLLCARIVSGTPQLLEHSDLRWITPAEIPAYEFCPADAALLERISSDAAGQKA